MFIGSPYEGIWGIDRVFGSAIVHQSAVLLLGIVILLVALLFFRSEPQSTKGEKDCSYFNCYIYHSDTILVGGIRYTQYNEALEQFITTTQLYVKEYEGSDQLGDYYE